MPRHFRIAADTGMKEFDDSCEPFEGKCGRCGCLHSGMWDTCDECIQYIHDKYVEQQQAEEEYYDDCDDDMEGERNFMREEGKHRQLTEDERIIHGLY